MNEQLIKAICQIHKVTGNWGWLVRGYNQQFHLPNVVIYISCMYTFKKSIPKPKYTEYTEEHHEMFNTEFFAWKKEAPLVHTPFTPTHKFISAALNVFAPALSGRKSTIKSIVCDSI